MVGKALVSLVRLLGPRRTLARTTKTLRSAGNFNETRQTDPSEKSAEVWINEGTVHPAASSMRAMAPASGPHPRAGRRPRCAINPHYFAGIFAATVRFAGASGVQVTVRKQDETGATYEIRWA